jgi:predicted HTH transcriptional regulator
MHSFSPFQKPFDEISAADLAVLKTTVEGWCIEYKQSQSNTSTIAKSISAFANTYGGWLFYGVEEDKEGKRTAGAFPGVPLSEVPQYEEWMTQADALHMSPPAFFEHRVLCGPEPAIDLPADRAVIMIHVPAGNDAPYVHSSGRIYRRVSVVTENLLGMGKKARDAANLRLQRKNRERASPMRGSISTKNFWPSMTMTCAN